MKVGRLLTAAAVAGAVGFLGEVRVENAGGQAPRISIGVSEAQARPARRVARRTSRRTVRRHVALPGGCPLSGRYYYCGGVYYEEVVDNGATVYIVVTP